MAPGNLSFKPGEAGFASVAHDLAVMSMLLVLVELIFFSILRPILHSWTHLTGFSDFVQQL